MKIKNLVISILAVSLVLPGCGSMSNLGKGAAIGGGLGTVVGAGVGTIVGKDAKTAAIGAAIGAVVGSGAGMLIGNKMDKKAADLAKLEGATIDTITDANNLKAIKVTFESGILFPTNSYKLNDFSKKALSQFAKEMVDLPETDMTILGHTDNTGDRQFNENLSLERAKAVADYLQSQSIDSKRMKIEGLAWDVPVADNNTTAGRQQNRRVEIYITANQTMIKQAEEGTLK